MKETNSVVYLHIVDGEVFYIGSGSVDRARSLAGRNDRWREVVRDRPVTVAIFAKNLTRVSARFLETALIREARPLANIYSKSESGRGLPNADEDEITIPPPPDMVECGYCHHNFKTSADFLELSEFDEHVWDCNGHPLQTIDRELKIAHDWIRRKGGILRPADDD